MDGLDVDVFGFMGFFLYVLCVGGYSCFAFGVLLC